MATTEQEVRYIDTGNVAYSFQLREGEQYKGDAYYGLREFDYPSTLAEQKVDKISAIDLKTHTKISEGVVFDGRQFSMSQYAQLKWTGIGSSINFGILVEGDFPLIFSDTSNVRYELTWANHTGFLQAVLDRVRVWTESGNELKQAVLDAQDQEAIDAVIDDRQ